MEKATVTLTFRVSQEKLSTGETVYVGHCKELDIASDGLTQEEAESNILEAVTLWFETASQKEVMSKIKRLQNPRRSITYTTKVEVPTYGQAAAVIRR